MEWPCGASLLDMRPGPRMGRGLGAFTHEAWCRRGERHRGSRRGASHGGDLAWLLRGGHSWNRRGTCSRGSRMWRDEEGSSDGALSPRAPSPFPAPTSPPAGHPPEPPADGWGAWPSQPLLHSPPQSNALHLCPGSFSLQGGSAGAGSVGRSQLLPPEGSSGASKAGPGGESCAQLSSEFLTL